MEALAAIAALIGVGFAVFWAGVSKGVAKIEAEHARDYQETRKEIDNADLGLGATDNQRIERLRDIAKGR